MRKQLKKSGLVTIILVSLAATAFLPKNVSQWVILGTIAAFCIARGSAYFINNKEMFARVKEKYHLKPKKRRTAPSVPIEFKYAVNQLSHRVTDKLHSAFPDSKWSWVDKPTSKIFTDGGRVRISTSNTDKYNEADVILDTYGRIEIKMLKTNTVSEIINKSDDKVSANYNVDTNMWYEQCGQKVLTDIITELNARGTKTLCINKDGSIVVDDNKQIGMLEAFPSKNLWKKLISVFEQNGLTAVENENSIQLGW